MECGVTTKDIERLEGKVDHILLLLTGNGNPDKGLIIRVDRLEQGSQSGLWIWDKILSAVVAALVAAGFSFLKPNQP